MNLTTLDTIEFNKILNSLNQKQHIKFPTHILGNRLDLILTLQDSTIISNIHTIYIQFTNTIADHYTIKSNITFQKKYTDDKKLIKFRSLSQINYNKFKFYFTNTYRFQNITNFNDLLTSLINVHAPIKSKTITNRTNIPWYNKSLNILKNNLMKAERLYKFNNSTDNLNRFISLRSTYRYDLKSILQQ